MPDRSRLPPELRGAVFRGSHVLGRGLLSRQQLRGLGGIRLLRDVYADPDLPASHGLYLRAAVMLSPPSAVIGGRSACWLYGADLLCLDVMLARGLVPPLRLLEVCAALPRGRGCAQAARAAELADGRAESPQESRLRVGLVLRGIMSFVPQYIVRHNGRFVARVDLGDPRRKLAVEYDGRWHAGGAQLDRDRRRLNALAEAGWRVHFVTAPDLYRWDELAAEVRAALAR